MTDTEEKSGTPEKNEGPDRKGGNPSTLEKALAKVSQNAGSEETPTQETGQAQDIKDEEEAAAVRPPGSIGRCVIAALSVLLLLAIAYIAWPVWGPALPGWMQASLEPIMGRGQDTRMGDDLARLTAKMESFDKDLARLKGEFAARPVVDPARLLALDDLVKKNGEGLAALKTEVEALGRKPSGGGSADEIAVLNQRITDIETRLVALAAKPADGDAAAGPAPGVAEAVSALNALRTRSSQRMTALESENVALRDIVAKLDGRVAAIEQKPTPDPSATRSNALLLAVGQLRDAGRGTAPFAAALQAVEELAEGDAALTKPLSVLKPLAETGVPDLIALRIHFNRIAGRIAHESFVPKGDSWIDRTLSRVSRVFTFRRTGPAAASADDENGRVARAELRLAAGDLGGAVGIMEGLKEPGLTYAGPWLKDARARLAVEAATEALFSEALARTRAGGGKGAPGG